MLELYNVRMKPSNVRKKIREPPNMKKELSNVMLELHNVRMEASNVRKKVRELPNMRKKTVTCDIGIAQYEDGIIKCEKKSKGTTKCEKKNYYM